MQNLIEELHSVKENIERSKEACARAKGIRENLLKTLMEKYGSSDLDQAEKKYKEIITDKSKTEKQLNLLVTAFQEKYSEFY